MLFSSVKEINRLLKEVNRLLSKGMSSIYYFKLLLRKNDLLQYFNILSWKRLPPNQVLGAPTHTDIIEFSKFLLQLKNRRSGIKTVRSFSLIFILKGIMRLQAQRIRVLCWRKMEILIKRSRNRKWKIPHTVLERWILRFSSYKNRKLRVGGCELEPSKHLLVLRTSATRLQRNNFTSSKTSWRRLAKTSWRRFEDVLKASCKTLWRRLSDMSWICLEDMSWRCLEDMMETSKILTGDICI